MRALWTAIALVVCVIGLIRPAHGYDDPKVKTRAEKLTDMRTAMEREQLSAVTEYEAAKGEKDKKAAEEKILGLAPAYAQKLYKFAEEDPKDEAGYEAAMMAVRLGRGNPAAKKAMDLVLTYHLDSIGLAKMVPLLSSFDEPGMTALKTLSEKAGK